VCRADAAMTAPAPAEVHYISPAILPSRSANSVHVMMQVRALADIGARVTLYACRGVADREDLPAALEAQYGVGLQGIRVLTAYAPTPRAATWRITALTLQHILSAGWPRGLIISRNLYAAFLLSVLARRSLVYEAHDVETGTRGWIQRAILRRPNVRTVAISAQLLASLTEAHGVVPASSQVLHDAAPKGIVPIAPDHRRALLMSLVPEARGTWRGFCGYFGHLYAGRGIEIIKSMAAARPDVLFLVAGGQPEDVARQRAQNTLGNLLFLGHIPHHRALQCTTCMDVLLMPYQTNVSLGVSGRDTARWMSPMKMFEYLASGVPLIASDLPVLHEVLRDGHNALLVPANDLGGWVAALDRLLENRELAHCIGRRAHAEYLQCRTWEHRAEALVSS
jgi:Glycosyl transferases group 1